MADGTIYNREKYIKSKTFDHSGWAGYIPRGATPSDVDIVWDDNGKFLFGESKFGKFSWEDLSIGQRRLYKNLLFALKYPERSAILLMNYSYNVDKDINTLDDCESFHVVRVINSQLKVSKEYDGKELKDFVAAWYGKRNPPKEIKEKSPPVGDGR
jgi:hypothetical protein